MKKYILIIFFACIHFTGNAQWNTDRILTIGRNALYFDDYVLSIQYFNQVIKIKPYLAEPYMYRAMAKIQLGDDLGADADASEAISRNPFLPQAYYIRGFARRRLKQYPEAIEDFSNAYKFSPNSLNLLLNRMDAYIRLEDYENAMVDLNYYIKLSPQSTNMYYEKGFIQMAMKDTTEAEKTFDKYIQLDSASSIGWSARALLKMQKSKTEDAYSDYSQAIKLKTNYAGDYINRGILNVQRKNFREALSDYDNAIKLDKTNDLAYYNRALLRANLGDNNNALSDLQEVLKLDSTNMDALYRKAMLQNTLGLYKKAIVDYNTIIQKYPYFIPAFWGLAEAEQALGNNKNAFRYKQMAYDIEQNKDKINKENKKTIAADNIINKEAQKSNTNKKTELFNRFVTQNIDDSKSESKYNDTRRGNVQDQFADLINERNFALSYYAKTDEIRRTNLYQTVVEDYNKKKILKAALKITNNEIPLTSDLINSHFESINEISSRINISDSNPDLYFNRALEFALVQDFSSAVDDLNKVLALRSDFAIAYFSRANLRYKLVDFQKNVISENDIYIDEANDNSGKQLIDKQTKFNVEMIMRDYDKVIELQPEFPFAYYNKANILCTQKDFKTAIYNYSKAIEKDVDFAEAYFNRGLTYLFIGDNANGLADLSKAGELGIYQSYNLLQRFSK